MFQISDIATNLQLHEDGIWYSSAQHPVSYPDDGNRKFYAVEEESFWFLHRNNCIIDVMHNYPPGGPILDIGGGNGFVSLALEKSGLEPILLEPGHDGVINARARGLPVILCSTLTDAGFREASVPAAGMFDVVEHVQDDTGFLRAVCRITAPGARVYLTVPAYNFLFSSDDREAGHHRRYSLGSLARVLDSAGFDIEYSTYIFSFLPVPIFLLRTFPTLLGLRNCASTARTQQEHQKPGGASGRLLKWLCDRERRKLKNRGKIRFGGSCLVVAHRRR